MNSRIYSFIFFFLTGFLCLGQNLVYSPGTSVSGSIEGKVNEYTITVTTPTPEAITFGWKRISNTFPSDWDFSLCDHNNCYIGMPASGKMFDISLSESQGGQKGFFKINILDAETLGSGSIQIYVYDFNDIDRGDTITFNVRNGTSSIELSKTNKLMLYPNPTNEEVNVYIDDLESTINIYSSNGELVKQMTPTNVGDNAFDVSDLSNGIYSIQLASINAIKQSRLLIQH